MANDTTPDHRQASYGISQAIAPGWERWRGHLEDASAPVRQWLISELAPQPGEKVLELAAGAGDTGFEAASLVGDDGRLVTTDFSPAMLEVARRRAADLGLGNVEFRVMDAEDLDLETDSVDGVVCRFGYMLMADPAAALAETRRVLRTGGRLVLAVWGPPERNPFFSIAAATLVRQGHAPAPDPHAPNPFSMASHDHVRALLESAGFESVKIDEVPIEFQFADLDRYLDFLADTAGPLALVLQRLQEEERKVVRALLEGALGTFETPTGYRLPGAAVAAIAR